MTKRHHAILYKDTWDTWDACIYSSYASYWHGLEEADFVRLNDHVFLYVYTYIYRCANIFIILYTHTTIQHSIDTWPYITSTKKKLIYIDHAYQLQGSQIGNPKPPHPKPQQGTLLQDSLSCPVERNPHVSDTSPVKLVGCPELCWKCKTQVFVFSQRWNKHKTPKRNWVWNVAKIKNIAGWPRNLCLGLNKKCDFQKRPS